MGGKTHLMSPLDIKCCKCHRGVCNYFDNELNFNSCGLFHKGND